MKKYVAGFLAGAVFVLSASAFADDIKSLVGKKIQGEAVVELNGQALDTAIIVDGKSYAPVRVIGEAAGYDVSMQNKKIILGEKAAATTPGKGQSVEEQKAKIEDRIKSNNDARKVYEDKIVYNEKIIEGLTTQAEKEFYLAAIDNYKSNIKTLDEGNAKLEAQLAALK